MFLSSSLTLLLCLLLWLSPSLPAQVVSGGMPTIETDFFSRLEDRFFQAMVAQKRAQLEPFLAEDFELRTASSGGELTLRDEWLAAATSSSRLHAYKVRGLTVRSFGETAIVSFFYQQQATVSGKARSGDFFVVDVWRKSGSGWKIVARYSAGPGVTPKAPADPKTK